MRFSTGITLLAALAEVAFGQTSCGATATNCPVVRANTVSASSCSSYFTRYSITTKKCYTSTVITTRYNSTKLTTVTVPSTQKVTLTTTENFTTNLGGSTVTYRPTTFATTTATAFSTTVSLSTGRTSVTSFSTSTSVVTSTITITGNPPSSTLAKVRRYTSAATVPEPCSCFLFTSTVLTRNANEFPMGTTTRTVSETVVSTSSIFVTTSTTLTLRGGVVTATSWVTSTSTFTQTVPTTVVSEILTTVTVPGTTVVTSTTVVYEYVPANTPDVSCPNNVGLEVALFDNPFRIAAGSTLNDYAAFNPVYFKTRAPYAVNRTSSVGLPSAADSFNPYGMTAKTVTYADNTKGAELALAHRGYFYAPKTGAYIFTVSNADDVAFLWVGQKAYTNWTRPNVDAASYYKVGGTKTVGRFQISLTAGSYTPFRVLHGNGLRNGYFSFSITDPAGTVYATTGRVSQYLVSFACDNPAKAPPFNAWGSENSQASGPPDSSCNNAGMEIAIYNDPYINDTTVDYESFIPESFKTQIPPYGAKIVNAIGVTWANDGVNQDGRYPYGFSPPQEPLQYTLNWRGYIYVPKSGTYTVSMSYCDNWCGVWFGDTAISGWNRANADGEIAHREDPLTFQVTWTGGEFVPLRAMMANWAGPGNFNIIISDETGANLVRTSTASPYLVRFSCDGQARHYTDPFGEET